jgi:hypothetical protein
MTDTPAPGAGPQSAMGIAIRRRQPVKIRPAGVKKA